MTSPSHTPIADYFFGDYVPPQEQRLRFVAKNGVQHSGVMQPIDPEPGDAVHLSILTDASLPIDSVAVYYTTDGGQPAGERGVAASGAVAPARPEPELGELVGGAAIRRWHATIPAQPDGVLVRYRIDAWNSADASGHWLADALDPFTGPAPTGREFAYHVDRRAAPAWTHDAIIYNIFVDRFAAAHDQPPLRDPKSPLGFYGGTLRGVTEKLDYIASLGVNCIWLSPVMETPTYHGYNPTDYFEVARRFGTNDDLRALIKQAHARGLRVLLDFVANHTSDEHATFLAMKNGDTPQEPWYYFGPEYTNGYLAYYGVTNMPVLRTDSDGVRTYLVDAARAWLDDFGADGLRLDNVSGPTHAFWTTFQEGIKATHPNALTLGEISGGMGDIDSYAGRFDACMDFPFTKLLRRVLAQRAAPLRDLLAMIEPHEAEMPALMARARMLDNHDMHRFLWLAENDTDRLKLALSFLMLAPGFPIIYYGAEVGLSQRQGPPGQDVYAREPMPWGADQRTDVLDHTRRLIALRASSVALRRGAYEPASVAVSEGEASEVGGFVRSTSDEWVLAIFNNGKNSAVYSAQSQSLEEAVSDGHVEVEATLFTTAGSEPLASPQSTHVSGALPPMSVAVYRWRTPHTAK